MSDPIPMRDVSDDYLATLVTRGPRIMAFTADLLALARIAYTDGYDAARSAEESSSAFIDELAREILVAWCANPQMFSEGAHVPYESLLVNAREFATYAWVERQTRPRTGAELLREIRERPVFVVRDGKEKP